MLYSRYNYCSLIRFRRFISKNVVGSIDLHFTIDIPLRRDLIICFPLLQNCFCADLVIEISDVNKQQDGFYRLVYDPPYGYPPPNTTISSREIGDSIQFSNGLPGTNYNFWLYYTNQTHRDWLTWRVSITTGNFLTLG